MEYERTQKKGTATKMNRTSFLKQTLHKIKKTI